MRKVKDYYFDKARKENFPARSVFKLEEAQKKYSFLRSGDAVLDLGCYPGSWALYAAGIVGPKGLVVGVDLQRIDPAGLKKNMAGLAEIHWLQDDIFTPECHERVRQIRESFDAVISDVAPSTSGHKWVDQQRSARLSEASLEIALEMLRPGGHFYCKIFQGEDFQPFVDAVRGSFAETRVVKPKSSRTESREAFVLGMRLLRAAESAAGSR